MLPVTNGTTIEQSQDVQSCLTVSSFQRKKRQTFVFSATIALSSDFRKKLKRGTPKSKESIVDGLSSIEALSERAGMRPDAAIVDLTNASIMASNLEESFLEYVFFSAEFSNCELQQDCTLFHFKKKLFLGTYFW